MKTAQWGCILFILCLASCGHVDGNYPIAQAQSAKDSLKIKAEYHGENYTIKIGERLNLDQRKMEIAEIKNNMRNGMGRSAFEEMEKAVPKKPLSDLLFGDNEHFYYKAHLDFMEGAEIVFEPGMFQLEISRGEKVKTVVDKGIIFINRHEKESLVSSIHGPIKIPGGRGFLVSGKPNKILIRVSESGILSGIALKPKD